MSNRGIKQIKNIIEFSNKHNIKLDRNMENILGNANFFIWVKNQILFVKKTNLKLKMVMKYVKSVHDFSKIKKH